MPSTSDRPATIAVPLGRRLVSAVAASALAVLGVLVPALVPGAIPRAQAATTCTTNAAGVVTCIIAYAGADQTWTVPAGVERITIQAWGAGGGGINTAYYQDGSTGAPGGYSSQEFTVTPGTPMLIVVGQGGTLGTTGTYGGGGGGGVGTDADAFKKQYKTGSQGGGMSGAFMGTTASDKTAARALVVAGGGGGASPGDDTGTVFPGGGGGTSGGQDGNATSSGRGGTQTAGGAAATASAATNFCGAGAVNATAGIAWQGGTGAGGTTPRTTTVPGSPEGGGGGGGGLFGGGGGTCSGILATGAPVGSNGTGGGGSGYLMSGTVAVAGVGSATSRPGGSMSSPVNGIVSLGNTTGKVTTGPASPGSSMPNAAAGVGKGGDIGTTTGMVGGNGQVAISYTLPKLTITKTQTNTLSSPVMPGAVINYQIAVRKTEINPVPRSRWLSTRVRPLVRISL